MFPGAKTVNLDYIALSQIVIFIVAKSFCLLLIVNTSYRHSDVGLCFGDHLS